MNLEEAKEKEYKERQEDRRDTQKYVEKPKEEKDRYPPFQEPNR